MAKPPSPNQAEAEAYAREIAQMIGTSRETVSRLFAELRKRQIVQSKGSTLLIRNTSALRDIANHN